jgi:mono/diheme cytochrome c family protein
MFTLKKQLRFFQPLILFLAVCATSFAQKETGAEHKVRWKEPDGMETMKNPLAQVVASADSGKITYMQICSVCHGSSGKGDGIAAAGLAHKPADHTSVFVQQETDGQLFWELTNGHAPMPAYKTVLNDKQRWQLICFIRTLKSKSIHK